MRVGLIIVVWLLVTTFNLSNRTPSPSVVKPGATPRCAHLYNVDRHREWAECMGVGYK